MTAILSLLNSSARSASAPVQFRKSEAISSGFISVHLGVLAVKFVESLNLDDHVESSVGVSDPVEFGIERRDAFVDRNGRLEGFRPIALLGRRDDLTERHDEIRNFRLQRAVQRPAVAQLQEEL